MDHTDPVLRKIRKILALAEDTAATSEEAETYTTKAAELIATYGVDRALLDASDPGSDTVGDRVVVMDAPYARDKATLLSAVAHRLRCQAVLRDRRHESPSVHVFGHASDLARVELLFTSLLLQAATALTRTPVPPGEHVAAFRRSWLAGFTSAILERLREVEERAAREGPLPWKRPQGAPSLALVLADRSAEVTRAVEDAYPCLGTAPRRRLTGRGRNAGYAAGRQADFGGRRVRAGGRRQIVG